MKPVFYLIQEYWRKFNEPIDGRKKIQKLMFLVEHWENNKIVKSIGLTGYVFKIYYYGPFCKKIYDDLDELVKRKYIEAERILWQKHPIFKNTLLDGYVDDSEESGVIWLYSPLKQAPGDQGLLRKIRLIVSKFGYMSPSELEIMVNRMLRLKPIKKLKYLGTPIDEYLSKENLSASF